MNIPELRSMIHGYFPGSPLPKPDFEKTAYGPLVLETLAQMEHAPIGLTRFNQVLHLMHEAGVKEGFFKYYFLSSPKAHPYPVGTVVPCPDEVSEDGIASDTQLEWGGKRFIQDALLNFGNVRAAFVALRTMSYDNLVKYFSEQRLPTKEMTDRKPMLELKRIEANDRHLVAELAAKAYAVNEKAGVAPIEQRLSELYAAKGGDVAIRDLVDEDLDAQKKSKSEGYLDFLPEKETQQALTIANDIKEIIRTSTQRWKEVLMAAQYNTGLYLSIANELDVYVATSMRGRKDFRYMAGECEKIFSSEPLRKLNLRYFDPTMSAAEVSEDKGLMECLMVKCASIILYFAGEKDSYGKDAEAAMALSLGKPVIIVCTDDESGQRRSGFFRDVHPLSRLIKFKTGVACGAIVTDKSDTAAKIIERIFQNKQEYDLEHDDKGYLRLRERLTKSVVRLQTNNPMLRETFWNYYGVGNQDEVRAGAPRGLGTRQPR